MILLCILFSAQAGLSQTQGDLSTNLKDRRNPFIPLVDRDGTLINLETSHKKKGDDTVTIEGIIFDSNGVSYAIIGGNVVRVGDFVGDHQVLKIEKDRIILIKNGEISEIIHEKGE